MLKKTTSLLFILSLFLAIGCAGKPTGGDGPGGGGGGPQGKNGLKKCPNCGKVFDEEGNEVNPNDPRLGGQGQQQQAPFAGQQQPAQPQGTGSHNGLADSVGGGQNGGVVQGPGGTGVLPGGTVDPSTGAPLPNDGTKPQGSATGQSSGAGGNSPKREIASTEPPQQDEFLQDFLDRKGILDGTAREKLVRKAGPEGARSPISGRVKKEGPSFFLETALGERIELTVPTAAKPEEKAQFDKVMTDAATQSISIKVAGLLSYVEDPKLKESGGRANYTDAAAKTASNQNYKLEVYGAGEDK